MSSSTSQLAEVAPEPQRVLRGRGQSNRRSTHGSTVAALLAGTAILLLLSIVPLALIRLSAALPLDVASLSPGALLRPDDGALLLLLLVGVAWASWATLAISVLVELTAALRGVPTPRVPGFGAPQRVAAALVTALMVGLVPVGATSGQPVLGVADLAVAVLAPSDIDDLTERLDARSAPASSATESLVSTPEGGGRSRPAIVTQRHDTLWLLAEQHLGSGERFQEIVELNLGTAQPDGRALADDGRLYPGWVLHLPADADLQAHRPERVVVAPGDTLWGIADEELHDPTRFRDLFRANRGDLQPDGRRLRDADLIQPGWVIALPADEVSSARSSNAGEGEQGSAGLPRAAEPDAAEPDAAEPGAAQPGAAQPGASGPSASEPDGAQPGAPSAPADRGEAAAEALDGRGVAGAGAGAQGPQRPESAERSVPAAAATSPTAGSSAEGSSVDRHSAGASTAPSPTMTTPATSASATSAPGTAQPTTTQPTTTQPTTTQPTTTQPTTTTRALAAPSPTVPSPTKPALARPAPTSSPTSGTLTTPPSSGDEGAGEEQSGDDLAEAEGKRAGIALPAGGAAAVLLLAALGVELARRRGQFQRWRRPGEHLPVPSARARRLEASLTSGAAAVNDGLLSAALGMLGALRDGSAQPRIRVVEVGPDGLVVHLARDWSSPEPPTPFRLVAPRVLSVAREAISPIEADRRFAEGALVTVGTRGDRTILVDLESVGTVRVAGDDLIVGEVVHAIAAEIAFEPRLRAMTRTVCLRDARLADATEVGDVIVDADEERVGRAVATALRRARETIGAGIAAEPGMPADRSGPSSDGGEALQAVGRSGPGGGDVVVLDPATADRGADLWSDPFEIVVADRSIGVEVPACSGVGLVTSAPPGVGVGMTLSVLDRGRAVLVEEGIELVPVGLSSATVDDLVELFTATDVPEDARGLAAPTDRGHISHTSSTAHLVTSPLAPAVVPISADEPTRAAEMASVDTVPADTGSEGDPARAVTDGPGAATRQEPAPHPAAAQDSEGALPAAVVLDPEAVQHPAVALDPEVAPYPGDDSAQLRSSVHANPPVIAGAPVAASPSAVASESAARQVPRLLLLGDVEVEHAQGKAESTRLGRLAETAAFVLLNPNSRPSELLAALWPGRNANPQSCRQMISRARSWLGRTDDGEPYLEPFATTNGRLRLRREVRSDWDDFQEHAAIGMADPADIEHLTRALELVRGRPFGSLWRREIAWADVDVHRMTSTIIDVAYELALRHEAAGRLDEARAAVHRAMRTQAESELLDELLERLRGS